ncbi:hypothetical protein PsorP6_013825 [Peronosclerospora sorghi]|uniref:Uncharacterized protein n=1 Tax=Peronosclerospora sorghi TaxID=230839 RepID=A0ACC0VG42_9STRA|nr:hypothetical protein PsorP6_013825 [Peronosclerospora sorghi]
MDPPSEIRLSNPPVHVTLASLTDTASDHYKDNTKMSLLLDSGTVDAPMEAVVAKVDVEDDSTAPPSPTAAGANVDRQPRLVDVEVDSNAPPTETATDANVDRTLRLVDVIRKASALRRDTATLTAAHTRVETPKPLASDVEAIEELYSKGTPWSEIATNITQARPYQLPRARYALVLETGASFSKTAPMKLLQSITSGILLTPPSSPPRRITPPPADTAIVVCRKNKRTQNSDDFANLTSKERPKDTTGITTSNYLSVLSQIEAEFDLVEAPLGVEAKPSFQIKPTIALVPDAVKKSTEASHFLTKHHTKVVKTTQNITVAETTKSMVGDTADIELDLLPDRLVMAAIRIPSAHKALKSATNPDRVIQVARQSPFSMNNAILEYMRNDDCDFQDLAQVLLLNRIFTASEPGEDKTFQKKWTKFMGIKLPSKCDDLVACLQESLRSSNAALVDAARQILDTAATRYKHQRDLNSEQVLEKALREHHDCLTRTSKYNQDKEFDFQAQYMEKSNRFFFRPLDSSAYRVSIEEVQMPDGSLSSVPQAINLQFMDHWGSVMGDVSNPEGGAPTPDSRAQAKLLESINRSLYEEEQDVFQVR